MKKFRALLALAAGACFALSMNVAAADWATSEGSCYAKGDKYIDVGIPLFFFPAVGVHGAFDYGFSDAISGGGGMGFLYDYGTTDAYMSILARAAFHPFNLTVLKDKIKVRDKIDVYGGLTTWIGPSFNGYVPNWGIREYLGARWHFAPKFCLFVEDCSGFGYLFDGGISFKF